MKQKKKNRFYTFILSFIPGAAEMYMGFMKKGVSLMALFLISIMICVLLEAETIMFVSVLIWFYSFFNARNIVASEDEVFANLEDDFIWSKLVNERNIEISNPAFRKCCAGSLIVFGVVFLWQNFSKMIYRLIPEQLWNVLAPIVDTLPEIVVALLIIYIGIRMIMGKKEELDGNKE